MGAAPISLTLRSKKPHRLYEHQWTIFANGEIDAEGADHGAANLHAQGRKAIKWFAQLVGILAETIVNETCGTEQFFATAFFSGLTLQFPECAGDGS